MGAPLMIKSVKVLIYIGLLEYDTAFDLWSHKSYKDSRQPLIVTVLLFWCTLAVLCLTLSPLAFASCKEYCKYSVYTQVSLDIEVYWTDVSLYHDSVQCLLLILLVQQDKSGWAVQWKCRLFCQPDSGGCVGWWVLICHWGDSHSKQWRPAPGEFIPSTQ